MDQAEELEQIATWFREEGLASDSTQEAQLCVLWRALQHTRSRLCSVTRDLEIHRSQHIAEMAEVRKSLEQIRIFTEHKDVLAQEIQNENDQLQEQLHRLVSLQDAQISEVAKMLYQQGLTELIHSSPSEQVAYLLVERASLLETSADPDKLKADGKAASLQGTEEQTMSTCTRQAEARHSACQSGSLERECSRLERDLEEGSRRLAMAHNEIRRLTDELESAHLTQRAHEPELQSAQQEVEQLRQEVEKLKKYEMVELRKAKELNDRLDLEIRALRNRVRCLDAEKNSLQQTGGPLQEKVEQQQQHLRSAQLQANKANEFAKAQTAELLRSQDTSRNLQEKLEAQTRRLLEKEDTVKSLQKEVEQLESILKEHQQQLVTVQVQAIAANELAESRATELMESEQKCKDLRNKLSVHMKSLLEKESEIQSLRQKRDEFHDNSLPKKENILQHKKLWKQTKADSQRCEITPLEASSITEDKELQTQLTHERECPDHQEGMTSTQDECELLKMEICETLKCLDKERSKFHEMKEKHKAKLCRAKQKLDDESTWRDEKIRNLERELSLSSHSLVKEKELVMSITIGNEKLLSEKRQLLQQLNEAELNKKDSSLTASLSKCRVDYLEMENKKLGNKIFYMSKQLAVLERSLQNMQSLHFAEEVNKMTKARQVSTSVPLQSSSVLSEIQSLSDGTHSGATKQTDVTSSPHCFISASLSRSAEMGYLNLTSTQSKVNL